VTTVRLFPERTHYRKRPSGCCLSRTEQSVRGRIKPNEQQEALGATQKWKMKNPGKRLRREMRTDTSW